MTLQLETVSSEKKETKKLFMQLSLNPDRSIYIKAPVFEEFFSSICPDIEKIKAGKIEDFCPPLQYATNDKGEKIRVYRLDKGIDGLTGTFRDDIILKDRNPNMIILTSVGLSDGITFKFNSEDFHSNQSLKEACETIRTKARDIFNSYIKKSNFEFITTMREV